jgi:hypothetical protein
MKGHVARRDSNPSFETARVYLEMNCPVHPQRQTDGMILEPFIHSRTISNSGDLRGRIGNKLRRSAIPNGVRPLEKITINYRT